MDQGQTNTPHAYVQQTKPDKELSGFPSVEHLGPKTKFTQQRNEKGKALTPIRCQEQTKKPPNELYKMRWFKAMETLKKLASRTAQVRYICEHPTE
jgi:hypothetical protein